jgi:hypothetical protein
MPVFTLIGSPVTGLPLYIKKLVRNAKQLRLALSIFFFILIPSVLLTNTVFGSTASKQCGYYCVCCYSHHRLFPSRYKKRMREEEPIKN